jgi:hypothetical protein
MSVPYYDGAKTLLTGEDAQADDQLLDAPGDEGAPPSLGPDAAEAYNEEALDGRTGDDATDRTDEFELSEGSLVDLTTDGLDASPEAQSQLADLFAGDGSSGGSDDYSADQETSRRVGGSGDPQDGPETPRTVVFDGSDSDSDSGSDDGDGDGLGGSTAVLAAVAVAAGAVVLGQGGG